MNSLFQKLIGNINPYKRIFIRIQLDEFNCKNDILKMGVDEIVLPLVNSAVNFWKQKDLLVITDINQLEKLTYIDYQLISSDRKYKQNIEAFNLLVNLVLSSGNSSLVLKIKRRLIYNDYIMIHCENEKLTPKNGYNGK